MFHKLFLLNHLGTEFKKDGLYQLMTLNGRMEEFNVCFAIALFQNLPVI